MEATGEQMTLFSQVASRDHANHTAQQVSDLEKKMTATSGQKCLEQYEKLNRHTLLGKMLVESLIGTGDWFSTRCNLIWKMKATKQSRLYFQLVPKMLHTKEKGYGLSLPTPKAGDWKDRGNLERLKELREKSGQYALMRELAAILVPTPTASDKPNDANSLSQIERDNLGAFAIQMTGQTGQLNPRFVAEMMGFPKDWTELPFLNGKQKA